MISEVMEDQGASQMVPSLMQARCDYRAAMRARVPEAERGKSGSGSISTIACLRLLTSSL
jgi:hypothetical protein